MTKEGDFWYLVLGLLDAFIGNIKGASDFWFGVKDLLGDRAFGCSRVLCLRQKKAFGCFLGQSLWVLS